jgi:hypothetical protein
MTPDVVGHDARCIFFAKFVPDHIFLQNRDKLNIKKILFCWGGRRPMLLMPAPIQREEAREEAAKEGA